MQSRDNAVVDDMDLRAGDQARADRTRNCAICVFAFRVAKHVKSNAIVYAKDGATVGIGAGQMSRVDSARIAALQGADAAKAAGLPESLRPRARSSPRTPSSRSPTACCRRSKPAPPR